MYGRYGYRRIAAILRHEGWRVNHKRVERIWKKEGLKVPRKQPQRGRIWLNDGSCVRLRSEYKDHVWSYDFVHAKTHDGRSFRMLTVIDEHTRECLAIDVARNLRNGDVLERLAWLMATRGVPKYIRSDNGAEFPAKAVRKWLSHAWVSTLYIEPGSPWENEFIESFNGKLREAKVLINRWRTHYNTVRPHSSLGYRPPAPETRITRVVNHPSEAYSATLHSPPMGQRNAAALVVQNMGAGHCVLLLGWLSAITQ